MVRVCVIWLCLLMVGCAHSEKEEESETLLTPADIESFQSTAQPLSPKKPVTLPGKIWVPSENASDTVPQPAPEPAAEPTNTPMGLVPESQTDGFEDEIEIEQAMSEDALDYEVNNFVE